MTRPYPTPRSLQPDMLASASNRACLTFDHRGIGASSHPDGPYTIDSMALDVEALMGAVGWPKAHVLGISMGGMVAQRLALDRPQLVQSLTLGATTHGGREAVAPPADFFRIFSEYQHDDAQWQDAQAELFLLKMLPDDFESRPGAAKLMAKMVAGFNSVERSQAGNRFIRSPNLRRAPLRARVGLPMTPASSNTTSNQASTGSWRRWAGSTRRVRWRRASSHRFQCSWCTATG